MMLLAVLLGAANICVCAGQDLVLDGVNEAALDLPRILFSLKRSPTGPALTPAGSFEANYGFLDTGASGIVLSRETADLMGLKVHPKARFADIGLGGKEYFDVSEPLYIGLAGYEAPNPENPNIYGTIGPGRFQIKKNGIGLLGEPVDVVGMPVMVGRVVVLNSGATNSLGYFAADIKRPGDPDIPKVDIEVALRLRAFADPQDPEHIPPLPAMARNPVIDNITIGRKALSSRGTWLLDTGATISLISTEQAARIGLTDRTGRPLLKPDFSLPLGGIGKMIQVPGFEIDELVVPTRSGHNIIFKNARLGVRDITFFDRQTNRVATLDGVFGSNFLCASAKMQGLLPADINQTIFERIVIDMPSGTLGFRLSRKPNR